MLHLDERNFFYHFNNYLFFFLINTNHDHLTNHLETCLSWCFGCLKSQENAFLQGKKIFQSTSTQIQIFPAFFRYGGTKRGPRSIPMVERKDQNLII